MDARESSYASYTRFERASDTPAETIAIYYDSYENLLAQGVPVASPPLARCAPQPVSGCRPLCARSADAVARELPLACQPHGPPRILAGPCPSPHATSDEDLMLAYVAGDAAAFDVLYGRHRGGVYRYLLRQCRHRGIADELFQDVWTNLIRARASYAPTAKFATWLYRLARIIA